MDNVLMGLIENVKNPLPEIVDIVGAENMEPIKFNHHIADGVHIKIFEDLRDPQKNLLAVYRVKLGCCNIDLENGIFTNEFYEKGGR